MPYLTDFERVLISRDGMSLSDALLELEYARECVAAGQNPEEILLDEYGLEADYILDLI